MNEWVLRCLLPLACWILLSGIDDLFVDLVGVIAKWRGRKKEKLPRAQELLGHPQKAIAILTPLWQESPVIGRMVKQNLAAVEYSNYHFFIGAYPNDPDTVHVLGQLESHHSNVHLALCPHDGPTSKADCLNWIYQRMAAYEGHHGIRFEIVVTHDAEDVIHPEALHWINFYADRYEMVQVPVLPVRTPVLQFTHGLYCDEFAEYQDRDMPVREFMGAFVPSNGVGTGFRRDALESLAAAEGNRIFEPVCLTEDYENGLRLCLRGAKQKFLPVQELGIATRELFPQKFRSAVRQRTRWVTGISLQTWDRHGWPGNLVQKYWLWRDRKGLLGSPINLVTNLIFLYGLVVWSLGMPLKWHPIFGATVLIGAHRLLYRMRAVGSLFGWRFAFGAFVRVFYGNLVNTVATSRAIWQFGRSKLLRERLVWLKTQHAYPSQQALQAEPKQLAEILIHGGWVERWQMDKASETLEPGTCVGKILMQLGYLEEGGYYQALSLQRGVPHLNIDVDEITAQIARSLPAKIIREWQVLPFRVEYGSLVVASTYVPSAEAEQAVRRFTRLSVRFTLITPANYQKLVHALL